MENKKFLEVEIADLKLDPDNPRLPERIKGAPEKDVLNWMLSDATLIDLMASISQNGFFSGEPIIVIPDKGKFIVIEGPDGTGKKTGIQDRNQHPDYHWPS